MEIAELELRVKGSGISVARTDLLTIGDAARQAATSFNSMGAAASQQLRLLGPGMIQTAQATNSTAAAMEQAQIKGRSLSIALSGLVAQAGLMGPAGSIAANVLQNIAIGGLAAAGPVGIVTTAIAALIFTIDKGNEAAQKWVQQQQFIREATRSTGDIVTAVTTRMASVGAGKFEQMAIRAQQSAREISRAFLDLATEAILKHLEPEASLLISKAAQAERNIRATTSREIVEASRAEIDSIKRTAEELAIMNSVRAQARLTAALQAGASKEVVEALHAEIRVAGERLKQMDQMQKKQFEEKFGPVDIRARELVSKGIFTVGGVTKELFEPEALPQAQQIRAELTSIRDRMNEIAKQGTGALPSDFEQVNTRIQQVGESIRSEFGVNVPSAIAAAQASLQLLIGSLMQEQKLTIDKDGAVRSIKDVQAELDALRAKAAVPIIQEVKIVTSGSPTLSFSDYFQSYAPGVIADFASKVGNIGIQLDTNFSQGIVSSLARIAVLENDIARTIGDIALPRRSHLDLTLGPRAELASLRRSIAFLSSFAGPSASSGGGGGGGGPIDVTININGTITKNTLDQDFFPKFERTLRTITGKDLNFRVLN